MKKIIIWSVLGLVVIFFILISYSDVFLTLFVTIILPISGGIITGIIISKISNMFGGKLSVKIGVTFGLAAVVLSSLLLLLLNFFEYNMIITIITLFVISMVIFIFIFNIKKDKSVVSESYEEADNYTKTVAEQIQIIKSTQSIGRNELLIKRLKSFSGSALLIHVNIDNQIRFSLANGEEKKQYISNGSHKITITVGGEYDIMEFQQKNTGKIFCINIGPPLKIIKI